MSSLWTIFQIELLEKFIHLFCFFMLSSSPPWFCRSSTGLAELWSDSCKHRHIGFTGWANRSSSPFHHSFQCPATQTDLTLLISSPRRCSTGKSLVTKINENYFPKTFQKEALQSTADFWHPQIFHKWPVQQGHLADEQAQAHLWPILTHMETTDSNPGSPTPLPTHPGNPATLSSPWSPLVLMSNLPPCFPNQAGLLLATSNNKISSAEVPIF